MSDRRLVYAIAALAVLGLGIAAYLTYIHYAGIKPVCLVQRRLRARAELALREAGRRPGHGARPDRLRGDPRLAPRARRAGGLFAGALIALTGFGFSVYLTYLELFRIHAICQWCVASAVIMTLLAALTVTRLVVAAPAGTPAEAR